MRRGQRSKAALPRWLLGVVRGLWGGSRLLKVAKKARTVYASSRSSPAWMSFSFCALGVFEFLALARPYRVPTNTGMRPVPGDVAARTHRRECRTSAAA